MFIFQGLSAACAVLKSFRFSVWYLIINTVHFTANGYFSSIIFDLELVSFVAGNIDIKLSVDVPADIEVVEPLHESCIWRQARGAVAEITGMDDPRSMDKVLFANGNFLQ